MKQLRNQVDSDRHFDVYAFASQNLLSSVAQVTASTLSQANVKTKSNVSSRL